MLTLKHSANAFKAKTLKFGVGEVIIPKLICIHLEELYPLSSTISKNQIFLPQHAFHIFTPGKG